MKRRTGKIIGLAALVVAATFILSWPSLIKFAVQSSLQAVRRDGTTLSWSGLSTGFSSVALETVTVWMRGPRVKGSLSIPLSLELQQLSVTLNVPSLLALSPRVTYSTSLYGGSIAGEAHNGAGGTATSGIFENIELGKHPQLMGLGIRGGRTNGAFKELLISPRGIEGGTFSFRLRELEVPNFDAATSLLRTQTLGTVDADAEGVISPTTLVIKDIRLASLFGSVVGEITVSDHLSPSPSLKGSLEVSLSENGITTLGPWLPLIPNGGLDSSTSAFSVALTTTPCTAPRTSATVLRLQYGCVKLTFTRREP